MYSHIRPHLINLTETSPDIEASVLVSVDGLIMTSTLPHRVKMEWNTECLGAICAGAVLLGQHASERCDSGQLEQVLIRCTQNHILMTYAGKEAILAVITKHEANLELIFLDVRRVADSVMFMTSSCDATGLQQELSVPAYQPGKCNNGYIETI